MNVFILGSLFIACKSTVAPAVETKPSSAPTSVKLSAEGVKNAQIRVQKLSRSDFAPRLTLSATIEPDPANVAHVGARATGRVASINARLGETVRRDQALVTIETVEVHQVSTEYMVALARAKEATDARDRQKQLVDERVGAVADLRRAEADALATEATLREAKEHLRFLGLSDSAIAGVRAGAAGAGDRSVVRAPIGGQITAMNVTLGQVLGGTEELFTIIAPDDLWATLHVFERDSVGVRPGAKVELRIPAIPDRVLTATIAVISAGVDPVTRTIEARAKLGQRDPALRPGMSAKATISLDRIDDSWWLPIEAVQPRGPERVVFIKTGDTQFETRTVSAGAERNGFIPVTSGLSEGEELVIHGAFALRGELEREDFGGE